MWRGLLVLVAFDLVGEGLARVVGVPLPGAVLGLAALLVTLTLRGTERRYPALDKAADYLLLHLVLFYVPATAGALYLARDFVADAAPIVVALLVSTFVGLIVAAWVFERVARGRSAAVPESP